MYVYVASRADYMYGVGDYIVLAVTDDWGASLGTGCVAPPILLKTRTKQRLCALHDKI